VRYRNIVAVFAAVFGLALLVPARAAASSFNWDAGYSSWGKPWVTTTIRVPDVKSGGSYVWVGLTNGDGALVQDGIWISSDWYWGWYASCRYEWSSGTVDSGDTCMPQVFGGAVTPGDVIKMSVNHVGGTLYRFSLWDETQGWASWHYVRYPVIVNQTNVDVVEYGPTHFDRFRFMDSSPRPFTAFEGESCIRALADMVVKGC
jgi:hypothetical protein